VRKLLEKVESSGYSQQQLEVLAKARGMSATQITKLRRRISKIQSQIDDVSGSGAFSRNRDDKDINKDVVQDGSSIAFDPFGDFVEEDNTMLDETPIFGMSFFQNKNLSFDPSVNFATPKGYQVGPGDGIIIDVWGASEQTYQLEVSPEGSIIIPSVGPIFLNGLSMERAEQRIKVKLKSIYSGLGENTYSQVSLGQIRTISVNVVGEAYRPGTYQMSSFATAFNALYYAGGPSEEGSLRNIDIFRAGSKIATLDGYDFLVKGTPKNIMLQDQDVLLIRPYGNRVSLTGEVKRPAIYEVLPEETLADALAFTGGIKSGGYYKSLSIRRNLANGKTILTVLKEDFDQFNLIDGDELEVDPIQKLFTGRVRVEGAVNHPGEYELKEGMKLSDVINLSDGFRPDVFLNRGVLIRQNNDLTLSSIAFSPKSLLEGQGDIALQSEDLIKVQSIFDMTQEYTVSIQGEVQAPGDYSHAEGITVENLIFMANGFKESAAKSFVEVARRITEETSDGTNVSQLFNFPIDENLMLDDRASNFVLRPFDLVIIRKSPFYESRDVVVIEGEVLYPGRYALESKTERISDLLRRAGGLTNEAYPAGGNLIRQTEYSDESEASKVKKLRLQALGQADTTAVEGTFAINQTEAIAIELEKIVDNPKSEFDLLLQGGDIISIPKELQTVRIRGEVYFSSNVLFQRSNSFKDYLSLAGGSTQDAKLNRSYVVFANGSAKKTRSFLWFKNYPKVEPGAEIVVPRRPEKRKLSPGEIIGISSGLTSLTFVVIQIVNSF
ncbi:MAG: protein involved in polysaccharide export with SLBB domain, partial [Parvicella sp.]